MLCPDERQYKPRLLVRKPKQPTPPQQEEQRRSSSYNDNDNNNDDNDDGDDDDDADDNYERSPMRGRQRGSHQRNSSSSQVPNPRRDRLRERMTDDRISHRDSMTVQRALASGVDINLGLAENYRPPRLRNNRTLGSRRGSGGRLRGDSPDSDLAFASNMGREPTEDLSVYDAPREGFPSVRSISVLETPNPLGKVVPPKDLEDAVDYAMHLSERDFSSRIMRPRSPACSELNHSKNSRNSKNLFFKITFFRFILFVNSFSISTSFSLKIAFEISTLCCCASFCCEFCFQL